MIETIDYRPPAAVMDGRIVLVTGAGSGIGRAVSLALASYGASVILLGRTRSKLETASDEITSAGGPQPAILEADLEKITWDGCLSLGALLEQEYGRLDGLLHNAGLLGERAPIEHYDPMTWHRVMHVNLGAPFLITRALLPVLKKSADPSIVFTSSSVGRTGRAFWGAYAVSKFGTEGLMQVLAEETENQNLRVNCLNPGATQTAMRRAAYPGEDPGDPARPESLVSAYLYLLGPASRGVTRRTFDAQGGGKPAQR